MSLSPSSTDSQACRSASGRLSIHDASRVDLPQPAPATTRVSRPGADTADRCSISLVRGSAPGRGRGTVSFVRSSPPGCGTSPRSGGPPTTLTTSPAPRLRPGRPPYLPLDFSTSGGRTLPAPPRPSRSPAAVGPSPGLVPDQNGRLGRLRIDGDGRQARSVRREPAHDRLLGGGVERGRVPAGRVDHLDGLRERVPVVRLIRTCVGGG